MEMGFCGVEESVVGFDNGGCRWGTERRDLYGGRRSDWGVTKMERNNNEGKYGRMMHYGPMGTEAEAVCECVREKDGVFQLPSVRTKKKQK